MFIILTTAQLAFTSRTEHVSTWSSIDDRRGIDFAMFSIYSKHQSYMARFKLNPIRLVKVDGNRSTARELNVDEKRIREWQKQEEVLLKTAKEK